MPQEISRRRLLHLIGATAGSAAAYQAAMGLGLMSDAAPEALPDLAPLGKNSRRVIILGAGIAGLTAAYELGRKGYECTVLEASARAGGRNLTLRHGTAVDEIDHPQVCGFDPDPNLYLNAGPARISSHHTSVLEYCRRLGVTLEPFVNQNRNAWVQDDTVFGGRPLRNGECLADVRGFLAELLAKAFSSGRLDLPVTQDDAARLLQFLDDFGDLESGRYRGSARAGLANTDTSLPPQLRAARNLPQLLKLRLWGQLIGTEQDADQAPMMLTPVGGMDKLVQGFMRHVGPCVRSGCRVESIATRGSGVDVIYEGPQGRAKLSGDFCLNGIPFQIMRGMAHDFPPQYAGVFEAVEPGSLLKIGLQMRTRFWERQQIYGGISWTTQDITQLWYPSHDIHGAKGVLLGAYVFGGEPSQRFERMAPAARLQAAVLQASRVHPDYREYVENGVSVVWRRMRHMQGCAAQWTPETRARYFTTIQAPYGRHYLIGDQVSYATGWQQGAIDSALHALRDIDARVRAEIA